MSGPQFAITQWTIQQVDACNGNSLIKSWDILAGEQPVIPPYQSNTCGHNFQSVVKAKNLTNATLSADYVVQACPATQGGQPLGGPFPIPPCGDVVGAQPYSFAPGEEKYLPIWQLQMWSESIRLHNWLVSPAGTVYNSGVCYIANNWCLHPDTGYRADDWYVDISVAGAAAEITIAVTAGQGQICANGHSGNTCTSTSGTYSGQIGESVSFSATPASGFSFTRFEGPGGITITQNPFTVALTGAGFVNVVFTPTGGGGGGRVSVTITLTDQTTDISVSGPGGIGAYIGDIITISGDVTPGPSGGCSNCVDIQIAIGSIGKVGIGSLGPTKYVYGPVAIPANATDFSVKAVYLPTGDSSPTINVTLQPAPPPPTRYSCVNGQCVPDSNGAYASLADCQAACKAGGGVASNMGLYEGLAVLGVGAAGAVIYSQRNKNGKGSKGTRKRTR